MDDFFTLNFCLTFPAARQCKVEGVPYMYRPNSIEIKMEDYPRPELELRNIHIPFIFTKDIA